MSDARKECLIGEAYFMRAFYYFQLCVCSEVCL